MDIGSEDGAVVVDLGSASILHSLYSTSVQLAGHGIIKPMQALNFLESGECLSRNCAKTADQLKRIAMVLAKHSPDEAVWDIDSPGSVPPWAGNLSPDVKTCADLYTTASGEKMIDALVRLLECASSAGQSVIIYG